MLHVEGRLALPLRHQHARVEGAQGHHVAQAFEQFLVAQEAGPRADRLAVAVEHADDRIGEVADRFGVGIDLRARHRAGPRDPDAREIGSAARPDRRFRHVKAQWSVAGHAAVVSRRTGIGYHILGAGLSPSEQCHWGLDCQPPYVGVEIGRVARARTLGIGDPAALWASSRRRSPEPSALVEKALALCFVA